MQQFIYSSIKKYGWDAHTISVECELPDDVSQKVLDSYEVLYWEKYIDCGFEMMNIRMPGSGGKLHPDSVEKMKASKKGFKHSEESKRKISESNKGRVMSPESIEKTRLANKGKKRSLEVIQKMTGKVRTEKTKQKMSLLKLGKSLVEQFGEERAKEVSINRSKGLTGTHLKPVRCNETGEEFNSLKEASEKTGISKSSIGNILSGLSKKSRSGLSFSYINKNK